MKNPFVWPPSGFPRGKRVWGAGSAHGCEHRVLCCLHRPGQRGGKEKSLACLLGIAWLPQPWRRGSARHPTEKLPRDQGLLHKNCPIPCLHPSVSQLFSYRLAQTPLFFLLLPLASILPNPDHIHQNITRISFLQDEETQISPQDFTC